MSILASPQVFRDRGFVFRMYFNEGLEPAHVHVTRGGAAAKFWLEPAVALCQEHGFNPAELRWIRDTLRDRHVYFMEQWHETQARTR